ncbi:hypothetical protein D7B24_008748 [Verticillium nonalfalfae]|uniref:Xylanolytic transcriptional activator regulatory domain-containing protein n=1 Tax=Verticillium nonalfalfae TaxID=1051616 RepID=A0A3M9Y748_9PEZI|nr:uncharacterized protein D7B24_008748 [Verticillium nonalfalfae]RNJ55318.1 hypothetical protein D7B24_008748 [Verticillium nonalfalfae]
MLVLVDAFFENIYPLPSYAFLHPETTKRRCRDAQVHRALASAVCAIAALHMGRDRQLASRWIQGAEQSIWLHLGSPTIPRLQTLLLIIHFRMETGAFQRAFMLTATAARFATAMRLNYERPDLDPISREVRRRIVWSLKIMERYFSIGLPEFELCPIESIYLEFPSPEEQFEVTSRGENGTYRLLIRLETIRRDVMKLNRSVAPLDEPLPSLIKLIRHHQQSLSDIGTVMPEGTHLTETQTLGLLGSPWLPRRVLMHISWHQAHCDLNRILLSGYPEAAPPIVLEAVDPADLAAGERQCLDHATSIIQILTNLNQQSTQRQCLEFDTAICAYHAARLVLFISRFGRDPDRPAPEFAASRADLCLTALKRFFPSSALVAPIIEELQRCIGVFSQQEDDLASFKLDPTKEPTRHRDLESQLSAAARARQRLAIHSLLRQAEFSDGDDDEEHDREPGFIEQASAQGLERGGGFVNQDDHRCNTRASGHMSAASLASDSQVRHTHNENTAIEVPDWQARTGSQSSPSIEQMTTPLLSWFGPQDWDWLSGRAT